MASDGGQGVDSTDAKGLSYLLGKLMGGKPRELRVTDVDENTFEAYRKIPTVFTKTEMLADVYKMDFPRRGKAILINNKHFSSEMQLKGYGVRSGTDIDATKIATRLHLLGFEVERYHDATCKDMINAFSKASLEDHTDADCFVGVILSHGHKDTVFGSDGPVELQDIFQYFKGFSCKSLAGKPKIFFIQACRGTQLDAGVNMDVADAERFGDETEVEEEIRIPNEADFLISYSTVPGYYSWRNSARGSWYAQALVTMLDKHGTTMEFQKLLTQVNKLVAYSDKYMSNTDDPKMHGLKQVPSFTSMLTKDLYFLPKK